jgi:hypothetical protein
MCPPTVMVRKYELICWRNQSYSLSFNVYLLKYASYSSTRTDMESTVLICQNCGCLWTIIATVRIEQRKNKYQTTTVWTLQRNVQSLF